MQHIDLRCWWLARSVYFACMVGIIQAQSCTRPSPGKHMIFSTSTDISQVEFPEESKVNFRCDFGFVRVEGSPTITCRNGNWTDVTLICKAKNCGSPGEVTSGYFEIPDGTSHLSKVIFHCNKGHILVGKKERMCRDGTWEGRNPVCEVVKCGEPPGIKDGAITSSLEDSYDHGSVVHYRCKADLTHVGARSIACEDDGTWKPEPPQCIYVECALPLIENAIRTGGNSPYGYLSYVTFECRKGFIMEGVSGLTCGIDGNWTSPYPICKMVTCGKPPDIVDGELTNTPEESYNYGSVVQYRCKGDFTLVGAQGIVCKEDGTWNPDPPQCRSRAGPPTPPTPTAPGPIIIPSPGLIAAIVLGVIAAVVFPCVVFYCYCCRKKKRSSQPFYFRKVLTKDDTPQPGDKSDDHAL